MGELKPVPQALALGTLDMVRDVFEGHKKISVRTGHRNFTPGGLLILHYETPSDEDGKLPPVENSHSVWCMATIGPVRHTTLRDVTEGEWRADGFDSADALLAGLQQFYGDSITWDSDVTVVTWDDVRGEQVKWYFEDAPATS